MLLLLKNLTIEGQKNSVDIVAVISIGVAMVAGSGSSTGLKSRLCSAMCSSVATAASAILPFLRSSEGSSG